MLSKKKFGSMEKIADVPSIDSTKGAVIKDVISLNKETFTEVFSHSTLSSSKKKFLPHSGCVKNVEVSMQKTKHYCFFIIR